MEVSPPVWCQLNNHSFYSPALDGLQWTLQDSCRWRERGRQEKRKVKRKKKSRQESPQTPTQSNTHSENQSQGKPPQSTANKQKKNIPISDPSASILSKLYFSSTATSPPLFTSLASNRTVSSGATGTSLRFGHQLHSVDDNFPAGSQLSDWMDMVSVVFVFEFPAIKPTFLLKKKLLIPKIRRYWKER